MAGEQTLAQRVRAKYPGAYETLSDQELETRVLAKFPGTYDKLPRTPQRPPTASTAERSTVADVGVGVAKGVGRTVAGLGQLVHELPGVSKAVDALYGQPGLSQQSFSAAREVTEPTNTAQRVGMGVEQIGEFFTPVGAAGKVRTAAEIGKAALLTRAQTGSNAGAAVSAGLTAAIPAVGPLASKASGMLSDSARRTMEQALGATKEWAKVEAAKLAPDMLRRGVKGSRPAMEAQAKATAARVGQELDAAYSAAAANGETVPGLVIRGHIEIARDALKIKTASGKLLPIPGNERAIQKLDELAEFVKEVGDDIPVDKAATIKRAWDAVVSSAGLYGPKATASATEKADAWAIRESAGAFRELLNGDPTIAALNKELSFWVGLKKVLAETRKRERSQAATGLVAAGSSGAGAIIGAMSGDSPSDMAMKAVLGGIAGRQWTKLVQSAWFKTSAAAPAKEALANALASQQPGRVLQALARATQALPGQLTPVPSH
jgi:hypothetical protein